MSCAGRQPSRSRAPARGAAERGGEVGVAEDQRVEPGEARRDLAARAQGPAAVSISACTRSGRARPAAASAPSSSRSTNARSPALSTFGHDDRPAGCRASAPSAAMSRWHHGVRGAFTRTLTVARAHAVARRAAATTLARAAVLHARPRPRPRGRGRARRPPARRPSRASAPTSPARTDTSGGRSVRGGVPIREANLAGPAAGHGSSRLPGLTPRVPARDLDQRGDAAQLALRVRRSPSSGARGGRDRRAPRRRAARRPGR